MAYVIWKITVEKKDADTGTGIAGATINLAGGPSNYYSSNVGMSSSTYTFDNLLPGNYTVTEIGAPYGYNLDLQTDRTHSTTVTAPNTSNITITNRQYGTLNIQR